VAVKLGFGAGIAQGYATLGHCGDIRDVDYLTFQDRPSYPAAAVHPMGVVSDERFEPRRKTKVRREVTDLAVASRERGHLRIAELRCAFAERIEHRLQVEGRTADDLQYIACCGLVFERFLKVTTTLAQFAQEPGVLHCDDRLGREIL
jgi:hypothetical protein